MACYSNLTTVRSTITWSDMLWSVSLLCLFIILALQAQSSNGVKLAVRAVNQAVCASPQDFVSYVSSYRKAYLPSGEICWTTFYKNKRQQRMHFEQAESKSRFSLKHHRTKYIRMYNPLKSRTSNWYQEYVLGI